MVALVSASLFRTQANVSSVYCRERYSVATEMIHASLSRSSVTNSWALLGGFQKKKKNDLHTHTHTRIHTHAHAHAHTHTHAHLPHAKTARASGLLPLHSCAKPDGEPTQTALQATRRPGSPASPPRNPGSPTLTRGRRSCGNSARHMLCDWGFE